MPEVSLGSPIANVVQSPQPKSNKSFVVPQLPIAKAEKFSGTQTRALADNIRSSRPSAKNKTSREEDYRMESSSLLTPQRNRLAVMGRDAPPDLSGVDSNTGLGPLRGVLATLQPLGGRVKEPELLVSSAPIYPAMATQAQVEGQVTLSMR